MANSDTTNNIQKVNKLGITLDKMKTRIEMHRDRCPEVQVFEGLFSILGSMEYQDRIVTQWYHFLSLSLTN
jgi:hypothetical protein